MSGKPPSPPGFTSPNAPTKDERAYKFISGQPGVDISSASQPVATMSKTEAKENLRWAEEMLEDAETMLEYEDSPRQRKKLELRVDAAQERVEKARDQYVLASGATAKGSAGLKPTEAVTSATLGKAMGKGRKKSRHRTNVRRTRKSRKTQKHYVSAKRTTRRV